MQSVMRNNVNTNYGSRGNQAKLLVQNGADLLMPKLAGQALSSAAPRGLQGLLIGGIPMAAYTMADPTILAGLLATSPWLMGEASHAMGRLKKPVKRAALPLYQAGRETAQ
jgi:hypothetical protein